MKNSLTSFEVVSCLSLKDSLAYNYLLPIARHKFVSQLWLIRHQKSQFGEIPKATYILTPTRFKPWRFIQMIWASLWLGRRKEVRTFVSFNPIPYGLFMLPAAKLYNKPLHFGFIGSDWYKHVKSRWGKWLLPLLRQADFVTVTGEPMRREMLAYDFKPEQVVVLPHSVDLSRFQVAEPDQARYACVFVGQLIHRKRVDLILQAFAALKTTHLEARLCIVGDGPRASDLQELAAQLDITQAVDFVGAVTDVQRYLAEAKIVVIASDMEGFPFALIEGICCGLVPVSTPVGTISDLLNDGENACLFPQNDAAALTACLQRLLDDPKFYNDLRANVLKLRQSFAYESAMAVWEHWWSTLKS